jgi:uncharacterized protein YukE
LNWLYNAGGRGIVRVLSGFLDHDQGHLKGGPVTMIGAELEQMQGLRATLDQRGVQVGDLARAIRGQLASTFWRGPAADRFRQAWDGDFEPALSRLQSALDEAAQEVQRRHDALLAAGS